MKTILTQKVNRSLSNADTNFFAPDSLYLFSVLMLPVVLYPIENGLFVCVVWKRVTSLLWSRAKIVVRGAIAEGTVYTGQNHKQQQQSEF